MFINYVLKVIKMDKHNDINIQTLVELLKKEGFKKVAEFNARSPFPTNIIPRVKTKYPLDKLPGVEVRIVDKAEVNPNYIPRRVYEVYKR